MFTSISLTRGWLSLDSAGNALFVWIPDDNMMMNAHLPQGRSTWTKPALISSEDIFFWKGSVDRKGNRLLTWIKWDDKILKSSILPLGENTWTAPVNIAPASGSLEDCQLSTDGGSAAILYTNPFFTLQATTGKPI